ncbi:hypothetical protein LZ31DRAFT_221685 [Colletotrichum somersetense]|nr:hypothetical protein LZ31DRAFT_221685 [Colletotrichum somersetense]
MVGFSSAALTSNCDDISHRAVSTSAELDSLLKAIDPGSIAAQHLISFSAKLEQFRDTTERLRRCLDNASAFSPSLRNALAISVQPCADAAAVVNKQIRRLDPGNVTGLNPDLILQYESYHAANTRLFTQYIQVIQMPTVAQQDSKLSAPDGHRLLETAVETSQIVLTRSDILQVLEESGSLLISNAATPRELEDVPTEAKPPEYAPSKTSKGKNKATDGAYQATDAGATTSEPGTRSNADGTRGSGSHPVQGGNCSGYTSVAQWSKYKLQAASSTTVW